MSNGYVDAQLEPSDEEILAYSSSESDEDEEDEEAEAEDVPQSNPKRKGALEDSEAEEEEEDEDAGGWGSSKRDYYDADNIETEADALEEEAEAKRLQQKRLQKMTEADFGFDESEWLDDKNEGDEGDVVTEVLKDVEITEDMSTEERLRVLRTRYPEFESLANEYLKLQPVFEELQSAQDGAVIANDSTKAPARIELVKYRALAAYMGALTMYFAVLTSTAKSSNGNSLALDPTELRDHSVMESLLQCRELWSSVKDLKPAEDEDSEEDLDITELDIPETNGDHGAVSFMEPQTKKSRKERAREAIAAEAAKARAERIRAAEDELQDLSSLIPKSKKSAKSSATKAIVSAADSDSDFGEEESLSTKAMAEKVAKKKSLRFYTSQIAQKANRRADAGRDAGGDADLPYRERLRDRQARLNAEAEKRGKKLDEYGRGTALGGDSDDDADLETANAVRDDEDEYYDMVAQISKKRKADKNEHYAAIAEAKAAGKQVRVVEGEVGEDGKRAIGYVIEKNKGLAPKRKKDVRNPRVKKRKKFEEKKKKLASVRAVYKGGEERGGYGGEKTGIKTGLVKSIKL